MSDTLTKLSELRELLGASLTDESVAALWPKVMQIDASLWGHADEDALMRRIRSTVTDVISAWRDQLPSPPVSLAAIAVTALDRQIRRKTTGPDGYPLA